MSVYHLWKFLSFSAANPPLIASNFQEEALEAVDHTKVTSVLCLSIRTCHHCLASHC